LSINITKWAILDAIRRSAAAAVLYAKHEGKTYFMTLQRANTHKWNHSLMYGPAETSKPKEPAKETMLRGLNEEAGLTQRDILSLRSFHKPVSNVPDSHGYKCSSFLVEISFEKLKQLQQEINQKKHDELGGARIVRRLGRINQKLFQPHGRQLIKPLIKFMQNRKL